MTRVKSTTIPRLEHRKTPEGSKKNSWKPGVKEPIRQVLSLDWKIKSDANIKETGIKQEKCSHPSRLLCTPGKAKIEVRLVNASIMRSH